MEFLSPGVYDREFDKTFYIKSEKTNAAAYVGLFKWGAVNTPIEVVDEEDIVNKFTAPDTNTNKYHLAAADYLTYASPLALVRAVGTAAKNAVNTEYADDASYSDVKLLTESQYESFVAPEKLTFMGKWVGSLANGLKVSIVDKKGFATWEYKDYFQYEPYDDLVSVAVIDTTGVITGIKNYLVEAYELLSFKEGATKFDNSAAYIKDVIQYQSRYLFVGKVSDIVLTTGKYETILKGGTDDYTTPDFTTALNTLKEIEDTDFMRIFTSFFPEEAVILAGDICNGRQDALCFRSPPLESVYNTLTPEDNVLKYFDKTLNKQSTYAFNDDNWKQVFDKFNGVKVWIPCCSSTAGLHARSIRNSESWYSPAGFNRGQLNNVIKLAWSANQTQRDRLYKSSINSIVSFKGEGVVLFGDKTAWKQPSAFDRVNVRTLFIILRKAIATSSRKFLFENNTFLTRKLFKSTVDAYLEGIKARGGLYDFRVVCDSTNNLPDVIDRNEFIGDIYLKPVKSINFIILNFTAVNTGASFEEYIGNS